MNTQDQLTEQLETKSSVDFCSKEQEAPGTKIVNNYVCRQRTFSSSDLWLIQKQRRTFTRRTAI